MKSIKVGILVSYDYKFLQTSVPLVYEEADSIVLALDKNRLSWTGNPIKINEDFFQWIREIDSENKIEIYEDDFYVQGLSAMECETRERNLLAKYMGEGGWHLQIDADEYFVDFANFAAFLRSVESDSDLPVNVVCELAMLFKKTETGYLVVDKGGHVTVATTNPTYIVARKVEDGKTLLYKQKLLHDSWARTNEEMQTKLRNWGHSNDFDTDAYYNFWVQLNDKNHSKIANFHPLNPVYWPRLEYFPGKNITELLEKIKKNSNILKAKKQPNRLQQAIQSYRGRFLVKSWKANIKKLQ